MSDLALKISSLEKKYASGVKALDGIDLEVKKGDFFALLGPNGAGKSSTIGIISSLVTKTSGSVKIFDIDIDEDFNEAKRKGKEDGNLKYHRISLEDADHVFI